MASDLASQIAANEERLRRQRGGPSIAPEPASPLADLSSAVAANEARLEARRRGTAPAGREPDEAAVETIGAGQAALRGAARGIGAIPVLAAQLGEQAVLGSIMDIARTRRALPEGPEFELFNPLGVLPDFIESRVTPSEEDLERIAEEQILVRAEDKERTERLLRNLGRVADLVPMPRLSEVLDWAIGAVIEKAGIDPDAPPEGIVGRAAEFVAEELAAGSVGAFAIIRNVRRAQKAGKTIGQFRRFVAENPRKFLVAEATGATGAGTARSVAPETPGAQLGAGIAGGLAGGLAPIPTRALRHLAVEGSRNVAALASEQGRRALARRRAGRTLAESAGDVEEVAAEIGRSGAVAEQIPGFQPTTAQASRSGGLETLQLAQSQQQPKLASLLGDLETENNGALVRAVEKTRPDVPDAHAAQAQLQANADRVAEGMTDDIERARRRYTEVITKETRGQIPEDISAEARRLLEEEEARVFGPIRERWEKFYEFTENPGAARGRRLPKITVDVSDVNDAVDRIRKTATKAERARGVLPSDLSEAMRTFGRRTLEDGSVIRTNRETLRELATLDSLVGQEIRNARKSGDRVVGKRLAELKKAIDLSLTKVEQHAEIGEVYKTLRAQHREAAERFRDGIAGKVLTRDPTRSPAGEATLGMFFRGGDQGGDAARRFKLAAKESPELSKQMERYIVSRAYDAASMPDGSVNPTRLRTWMRTHRAALREFPEARKRLRTARQLETQARDLEIVRKRTTQEWERSSAGLFVENPRNAVRRILRSENPRQEALRLREEVQGNPEALRGLARVFFDAFLDESMSVTQGSKFRTSLILDPVAMKGALERYRGTLTVLLGREQVDRLDLLQRASEVASVGRIPKSITPAAKPELGAQQLKFWLNKIWSIRFKLVRTTLLYNRFLDRLTFGEVHDVLNRALTDPKLATDLMREVTAANQGRLISRMQLHIRDSLIATQNLPGIPARIETGRERQAPSQSTSLP